MMFTNEAPRILIVDDTHENMEIIGKSLEKEGYDLYVANDGYSAIELVGKIEFDLILMDIMMPGLDGYETISKIKQLNPNFNTPLIFLTAKADIDSVIKGFEMGGADYIRKPFNSLELKARVKYQVELRQLRAKIEYQNKCLKEANDELKRYAITDPLTRLFNRREIISRIQNEMDRFERSGRKFSIIIGDIDYFKQINDTYGHRVGDEVLQKIAQIFLENIRKQDSVARWGGEEFLFVLPETEDHGALILGEKLKMAVQQGNFGDEGQGFKVTMTFGVCCYTVPQKADDFIGKADQALYIGKSNGRNQVVLWKI